MNKRGFSLTELMIVVALVSIIGLLIAKLFGIMNKTRLELESQQILRFEGSSLLSQMVYDISLLGNGINKTSDIALIHKGTPINTTGTLYDFDSIFFFYQDANGAGAGNVSANDIWLQYYIQDGSLYRRECTNVTHVIGSNYSKVIDPSNISVRTRTSKKINSNLVVVNNLTINFFASRGSSVQEPNSASTVRIILEISRGTSHYRVSKKILLYNILNGLGE